MTFQNDAKDFEPLRNSSFQSSPLASCRSLSNRSKFAYGVLRQDSATLWNDITTLPDKSVQELIEVMNYV